MKQISVNELTKVEIDTLSKKLGISRKVVLEQSIKIGIEQIKKNGLIIKPAYFSETDENIL